MAVRGLESLTRRVQRLRSGMAWSESPPSFTRHFVGNLQVEPQDDGHAATSSLLLVKNRRGERALFSGQRRDRLVTYDGRLLLSTRPMIIDESVLTASNLSTFFQAALRPGPCPRGLSVMTLAHTGKSNLPLSTRVFQPLQSGGATPCFSFKVCAR